MVMPKVRLKMFFSERSFSNPQEAPMRRMV